MTVPVDFPFKLIMNSVIEVIFNRLLIVWNALILSPQPLGMCHYGKVQLLIGWLIYSLVQAQEVHIYIYAIHCARASLDGNATKQLMYVQNVSCGFFLNIMIFKWLSGNYDFPPVLFKLMNSYERTRTSMRSDMVMVMSCLPTNILYRRWPDVFCTGDISQWPKFSGKYLLK